MPSGWRIEWTLLWDLRILWPLFQQWGSARDWQWWYRAGRGDSEWGGWNEEAARERLDAGRRCEVGLRVRWTRGRGRPDTIVSIVNKSPEPAHIREWQSRPGANDAGKASARSRPPAKSWWTAPSHWPPPTSSGSTSPLWKCPWDPNNILVFSQFFIEISVS